MTTPPEGPGEQGRPQQDWQPTWQPQYPPAVPPGQPAYGYPPAQPRQGGYAYLPPEHPKATTTLVLGILGLVTCQVLSPFAWVMGKQTVTEIDASAGRLGGRSQANAGYILGIVGTVLLGLGVAFLLVYGLIILVAIGASA